MGLNVLTFPECQFNNPFSFYNGFRRFVNWSDFMEYLGSSVTVEVVNVTALCEDGSIPYHRNTFDIASRHKIKQF
jgi:hypothetical protein